MTHTNYIAPKLSAIVLAYNHERYIAKAIGSLLDQTIPVQIVICDDASTDNTASIAKEILDSAGWPHKSKLIHHLTNRGCAATFNEVVNSIDTDICFVNEGDDFSEPVRAERVLAELERHPDIAMVGTALWQVDDENRVSLSKVHGNWTKEDIKKESFDQMGRQCVTGPSMAFRRSLMDAFGPVDRRVISVDLILTYRALALGGIKLLPEKLTYYRYFAGAGGISSKLYHWNEPRKEVKKKFRVSLKEEIIYIE